MLRTDQANNVKVRLIKIMSTLKGALENGNLAIIEDECEEAVIEIREILSYIAEWNED